MEEDAQQRITYLLQEIDANICAAHRSATQICSTVRRHHQILRQIHEATQVWRPLFDSFTVQPAVRRPPARTPGSTHARSTPASRATTVKDTRSVNGDKYGDGHEEDVSIVVDEQNFRTTTLQKHMEESMHDSSSMSVRSDQLPQMTRTSYIPTPAFRHNGENQDVSALDSVDRTTWSPTMSSPPRTGVLKSNQHHEKHQRGTERHMSTPNSVISSVAYNSPGVNKNLMKMGAFEFTPPQTGKSKRADGRAAADRQNSSLVTPEMPEFATVDVTSTASALQSISEQQPITAALPPTNASHRKRKRTDSTPMYPKTLYPTGLTPSFSSPASFSSLRRKYSTGDYSTPTRLRKPESRVSLADTVNRSSEALMNEEEPLTPTLDLASPLLRTQLKAMTPHTPLSNRLVGASLDIGSLSQESKLQEYDESFNGGEPAPQFELSVLPSALQRGVGAVEISTLYSKFQGTDDQNKPAFSVDHLAEMLPDYGKTKIEMFLDCLVSKRFLRPFVVEGTMFWQIPT